MKRFALTILFLLGTAQASDPLLRGNTLGLPWGLYSGGLTDLDSGEARLRLSAPAEAKVLGTRYDAATRTALITYRSALSAREAMAFAVGQLERQGFTLTQRDYPQVSQARALLRRTDRLVEMQVLQSKGNVISVLYTFRSGDMPTRLLADQAPDALRIYDAPLNLQTVDVEPGLVYLTPPDAVMIDLTSYRNGAASLLFYGNYSLQALENFYEGFFEEQGFVMTPVSENTSEKSRTYRLLRADESYTLTLNEGRPTTRARVTLQFR